MKCSKCNGLGYIESFMGVGNSYTPALMQCPLRCDIMAYSDEVQKRLNDPKYVTKTPVLPHVNSDVRACAVIPFRKRDRK